LKWLKTKRTWVRQVVIIIIIRGTRPQKLGSGWGVGPKFVIISIILIVIIIVITQFWSIDFDLILWGWNIKLKYQIFISMKSDLSACTKTRDYNVLLLLYPYFQDNPYIQIMIVVCFQIRFLIKFKLQKKNEFDWDFISRKRWDSCTINIDLSVCKKGERERERVKRGGERPRRAKQKPKKI
jgi:hypothetical protein